MSASNTRGRRGRLLLVEDNASLRRGIARALAPGLRSLDEEARGDRAVARLRDPAVPPYDVVLTDLRLPGADGLAVLDAARSREARTAVLLMTAFGKVETAVEAMRRGAFDFVQKPFELPELEVRVGRALGQAQLLSELRCLREERRDRIGVDAIVGSSPALREAVALATRVAASRSTVLVTGETGTGKELVAGLIHTASPRAEGPFVKVNCAALPETLLESELFGHERGAFTSADRVRIGRFEQADGAPSSWTRWGTCLRPPRRSCCACSRTSSSSAWGGAACCTATSASWPPPTGTCARPWLRGPFALISISASR